MYSISKTINSCYIGYIKCSVSANLEITPEIFCSNLIFTKTKKKEQLSFKINDLTFFVFGNSKNCLNVTGLKQIPNLFFLESLIIPFLYNPQTDFLTKLKIDSIVVRGFNQNFCKFYRKIKTDNATIQNLIGNHIIIKTYIKFPGFCLRFLQPKGGRSIMFFKSGKYHTLGYKNFNQIKQDFNLLFKC